MTVNAYQIDDTLQLTPFAPEQAAEMSQQSDARIWLDLQTSDPTEIEAWLDTLEVSGLSRRLCLEALDHPGFYPLKKEIVLVLRNLPEAASAGEVSHCAFLCRENLLLTLHHTPVSMFYAFATEQNADDWLPERSIAGLVSALMNTLSLGCLQHTFDFRESIFALEDRMEREPEDVGIEEIVGMRSELLTLDRVVSEQLPVVHALSRIDKAFFKLKDAQEYMNCALANLQAADRSMERLDKRVSDLRSAFQMHAQDKTNRRLSMLTVLSAIFLPMTLLAGIYGMNFEVMPELKYPFAYPVAIGSMVLIASGMYLYFWKKGWFD
ncbi:MAG: magnesium transporter CorA family protein [bacterium]|nr:magnesium transporter CorA family protein [bacterium]